MSKRRTVRLLSCLILAAMLMGMLPVTAMAVQSAPVAEEPELNKLVGYYATTADPERQGPVFSASMVNDQNQSVTLDAAVGMLSMDFGAAAYVSRVELTSANATTELTGDDFDVWLGTENFGKVKFMDDGTNQTRAQLAKLSKQDYSVTSQTRNGHAVLSFRFFDNAAARYLVIQMKNPDAAAGTFVLEQMARDTAVYGRVTVSDSYEQLRIQPDSITGDDGTGSLSALSYTAFDKKNSSLVLDMGSDHAVREIILRAQDEAAQIPAEHVQLYYSADGVEYERAAAYTLTQEIVDGRRELHFVIDEENAGLLIGRYFKIHYAGSGAEAFYILDTEQDIQVSYDPFGLPDSDPERRQGYSIGVSAAYFDSRLKGEYGQEALDKRNELSVEEFVIWYLENLDNNFNYLYRWENIGESVAADNVNISTAIKLPAKAPVDQVVVTSTGSANIRLKPEDWIISYSNNDRDFTVLDASTMTFRETKINGKTAHVIDFPEIEAKTLLVYNTYTKNFTELPAGKNWFVILTDQSSFAAYNKVAEDALFYTAPAAVHKLTGDVMNLGSVKTNLVMDLGDSYAIKAIALTPKGTALVAENWKLLHRTESTEAWAEVSGWTAAAAEGKHVITLAEALDTRYLKLSYVGEFDGEDYFAENYTEDVTVTAASGAAATTYTNTIAATFASNYSYLYSGWDADTQKRVWDLIQAEPDPVKGYWTARLNGLSIGWTYRITARCYLDSDNFRQSLMLYFGETKQVNEIYIPTDSAATNLRVTTDDWYVAYSTDDFANYDTFTPGDLTVTQSTNDSNYPCVTIQLPETVSASHIIIYTTYSLGTVGAPAEGKTNFIIVPGNARASLQPRDMEIKPSLRTTGDAAVSSEIQLTLEQEETVVALELTPKSGTVLDSENLVLDYWNGTQWETLTGWTPEETDGKHVLTLAEAVKTNCLKLRYTGSFSGSDYFGGSYSGYGILAPESENMDPVSLATGLTTRGFAYNAGYITGSNGLTAAELWALIAAEPDPVEAYRVAKNNGLGIGWTYRIAEAFALDTPQLRQSIMYYWAETQNVSRLVVSANRDKTNLRVTENDWYVAYSTDNFTSYETLTPEDLTVTKGTTEAGYPCFTIDFPTVQASHIIVYTSYSLGTLMAPGSAEAYLMVDPNNGSLTASYIPGYKTVTPTVKTITNAAPNEVYLALKSAKKIVSLELTPKADTALDADNLELHYWDGTKWVPLNGWTAGETGGKHGITLANAVSTQCLKLCYTGDFSGDYFGESYSSYAVKAPESDNMDPVSLATGLTTRGFAYNASYITGSNGLTAAELWALIAAEPDPVEAYRVAKNNGLGIGWTYRISAAYALDANAPRQSIMYYWAETKNVSRLVVSANRDKTNLRVTENDWYVAYSTDNFTSYETLTPEDLTVTKGTTEAGYPCFTIDFPTVKASHIIVYTTYSLGTQTAPGSTEAYLMVDPNNGSLTASYIPGYETLVPTVYTTDPFAVPAVSGEFALDISGNAIGFKNMDGTAANHIMILGEGAIHADVSDFRLLTSQDNASWTEVTGFTVSTDTLGNRCVLTVSTEDLSDAYMKLLYVGESIGNFRISELRGNVLAYADTESYDFSSLYAKAAQIGYAEKDRAPATGAAANFGSTENLVFDANYRSLVADLGAADTVNYIKLFDDDGQTRLSKQDLSIYVSDDNVTYTKIDDFDFRQEGKVLHLYNFTANGRYIKVHQNHYEFSSYIQDKTSVFDYYGSVKGGLQALMQVFRMPVFTSYDTTGYAFGQGQWKYYKDLSLDGEGSLVHLSYEQLGLDALVAEGKLRGDYGDLRFATADGKLLHSYDNGFGFYVRVGDAKAIRMFYGEPNATSVCDGAGTFQVDYGGKTYGPALGGDVHMAMLSDGRMIQIAYADHDDLGGEEVYMAISEDNGLTFGDPVRITNTPNHDAQSGGITVLEDGSVLVTYMWLEKNGGYGAYMDPEKTNMQIYAIRSTDLVNWSEPALVETGFAYNLATTNPYQAANGDIYLPLMTAVDNHGSAGICVMRSKDNGQTWENVSGVYKSDNAYFEGGYSEPCVIELEEGTIRVFFRQGAGSDIVKLGQITSYDNGENWTPVEQSDFYATCTQPVTYKLESGRILLLWAGHNGTGSNTYQRMPVTLVYSDDNGETWHGYQELTGRTLINNPFGHPMALQPDFCYAPDGSLTFMIWVRGTIYAPDGKWVSLRLEDFDRWMEENTGAFDDFEQASVVKNNYWSEMGPRVGVSAEYSTSGKMALRIADSSSIDTATAVRNFMGVKKGSISVNVNYASAASGLRLGLWECEPVHVTDAGNMFALDISKSGVLSWVNSDGETVATSAVLEPGKWYNITMEFDVNDGTMGILVDGVLAGTANYTQQQNVIAYFAAYSTGVETSGTEFWLDDLIVIDSEDAALTIAGVSEELDVKELPGFEGFLTLNETIDLNLIIPENVETEGNVISLKFADGTDAPYTIVDTVHGPAIRHSVFSNQMTREITVQILDAEGSALTKALTISVRDYAEKLLATTTKDTEKALMIRMLDYGALAQLYVNANETDLANSIVDSELRNFINSYDMGTPVAYTPSSASTDGVFSANLTLSEAVIMNIVTNTSHIDENEKLVVKMDDVVLTEDQYEMVTSASGEIRISYSFHADKMNKELTVAIVDKDTNATRIEISLSIRKYAHLCMDAYKEINPTLCTMLVAMLDYGALAQKYANPDANDLANRYVSAQQRATLTEYSWP